MRRPPPLLVAAIALALAGCLSLPAGANYDDLLAYLEAVGGKGKNFVSGLLAPRLDMKVILELLKSHMKEPWPALRLPRLDPLDIGASDFDLNDPDLGQLQGRAEGMQVRGLSEFTADDLTLEPLALAAAFNVTWARLVAGGNYTVHGNFAGRVPTNGSGKFNVTLLGTRLWGRIELGADEPTLYVRSLDLHVSLANATGYIRGLHRDPEVAQILSDTTLELLPEALRCCAGPPLSARLSASARGALNDRLLHLRAASHSALAWARAAAAADRVLSLARPNSTPSTPVLSVPNVIANGRENVKTAVAAAAAAATAAANVATAAANAAGELLHPR